tara:strand:- start:1087 stop:1476 length:390 start_codon:yes stop_codon:yes gene_type:complete
MRIEIPVSFGELIDKLTILEIKKSKITDNEKLKNIQLEFELLNKKYQTKLKDTKELQVFYDALLEVNHKLWKIEDKIRILENNKEFNEEFIDLARSVYKSNDERFAIKNEINKTFDSEIQEQKEYENYS